MTPYPRDKGCYASAPIGSYYPFKESNYLISIHPSLFIEIKYDQITKSNFLFIYQYLIQPTKIDSLLSSFITLN